jgi:hypothetical protein
MFARDRTAGLQASLPLVVTRRGGQAPRGSAVFDTLTAAGLSPAVRNI